MIFSMGRHAETIPTSYTEVFREKRHIQCFHAYFFRTVTVVIVVIIVSLAPNKNNNGPKYLDQRSKFFGYFLI